MFVYFKCFESLFVNFSFKVNLGLENLQENVQPNVEYVNSNPADKVTMHKLYHKITISINYLLNIL